MANLMKSDRQQEITESSLNLGPSTSEGRFNKACLSRKEEVSCCGSGLVWVVKCGESVNNQLYLGVS